MRREAPAPRDDPERQKAGIRGRWALMRYGASLAVSPQVGSPHIRHLTGPLWEKRFRGRGRLRASTVCCREGLAGRGGAGIREEDRRTPRRVIELALRRAGEVS